MFFYICSIGGEPQVVELPAVEAEVKPVVKKSTAAAAVPEKKTSVNEID